MSEEKIESSRNFLNKLWNISRFIISDNEILSDDYDINKLSNSDKWILNKLKKLTEETEKNMSDYKFSLAGENLKDFTWNDLADWYLEAKKFEKDENNNKILIFILKNILKLWHPFIPFITEVIWEHLGEEKLIMVSSWPEIKIDNYQKEEEDFEFIREIITSVRNARAENKIEPSKKISAFIISPKANIIESNEHLIKNLKTGIEELTIISDIQRSSCRKKYFNYYRRD
jgi:valyl-tRNA synthetase